MFELFVVAVTCAVFFQERCVKKGACADLHAMRNELFLIDGKD
jgi:hypothetical protein